MSKGNKTLVSGPRPVIYNLNSHQDSPYPYMKSNRNIFALINCVHYQKDYKELGRPVASPLPPRPNHKEEWGSET